MITILYRAVSSRTCQAVEGILGGDFLEISIGKCTNQGLRRSLLASLKLEAKLGMEYWNVGMLGYREIRAVSTTTGFLVPYIPIPSPDS